ncbi:MAG: helix-turn-helix domain-containing protein [Clostridia bacterium]|nr:helix-turn-helix domain-containing protein [Clostridia bacterium]
MEILSNFAERLNELIIEKDLTQSKLAESINVEPSTISRYLSKQNIPEIDILIRIADYFNCSVDFLIGRTEIVSSSKTYNECPQFSIQFKKLIKRLGVSRYELQKTTKISKSIMYYWETGINQPSIENLIKIADKYDYTLDFILGRVEFE